MWFIIAEGIFMEKNLLFNYILLPLQQESEQEIAHG